MDATLQQFISTMRSGEPITSALTDAMLSRYPFFSLPAVLELKQSAATMTDERRQRLSACVALNAPDGESLMKLIDPDGKRLAALYPTEDTDNTPSTDDAINTFLDTYGKIDEREQALLERLIFNPVPDYSSVLAREQAENRPTDHPGGEQDRRLEAFLDSQRTPPRDAEPEPQQRPREHHTPKPPADSTLSESLSKIYIKQRRFDKAYEIISQLSLKNPEKSVYFADQLRFLQKLMLNKQYSNK